MSTSLLEQQRLLLEELAVLRACAADALEARAAAAAAAGSAASSSAARRVSARRASRRAAPRALARSLARSSHAPAPRLT